MESAAKEDWLVYRTMADPLLDSPLFNESSIPYKTIVTFISMAISVIFICISVLVFRKHRAFATSIALASNIKSLSAATLPSFIYTEPTTASPVPLWHHQLHSALPHYNTYILLTLSVIAFVYIISQRMYHRRKPSLVLEISYVNQSCMCTINTLPTCISSCTFNALAPVTNNEVTCQLVPKLSVN